ncbi:hypothetical protein SAMN05519103_09367 [Rhizobiales bacterium GAS113]|nr:hypothetical protein SAMN05519103_09367 [Rhizobiales bacterium GAS113]
MAVRPSNTASSMDRNERRAIRGKASGAMYPLSAIYRLSAPVAVCIFAASVAVAETTTVGTVDKVQAQVSATQAGQTRALATTRASISGIDATAETARAFG